MSDVSARKRVRVRKARNSSTLHCGHHVLVGQLIVSRSRGPWVCQSCALAGVRGAALTVPEVLSLEARRP